MNGLYFIIGVLIVFIPYIYLKGKESDWQNNSHTLIAKWLSTDKSFECYRGGYVIYANKTRWYIETWVGCKLVWIPESMGDIDKVIESGQMVEFQATWLNRHEMYKLMRKIINTHPNLEAPNWYWSIVKAIE